MKRKRVGHPWLKGSTDSCSISVLKNVLAMFLVIPSIFALPPVVTQSSQYRPSTIEGTVTDFLGLPIPNATVYVFQNGRSPTAITDAKGNFVLTNIAMGEQRIFAYKESDNYPNPVWSFYADSQMLKGFPVVTVRADRILRNVVVRLGPKASRLNVKVTDAVTKRPVSGASISLNHEGKPKTLFTPGATGPNGELAVLIPSGIPIIVKVTATGYQTSSYKDISGSRLTYVIQLKTGESRSIEIELTRNH